MIRFAIVIGDGLDTIRTVETCTRFEWECLKRLRAPSQNPRGGSLPGRARRLPANCNRSVAVTVVAASPLIACRRPHPAIAVIVAVAVAVEGIPNTANE